MERTIVALDPGLSLGVAVFRGSTLLDTYVVEPSEHFFHLSRLISSLFPDDVVVCEDYHAGQRLSDEGKFTLKLIGVIECLTRQRTGRPPVYQQPQARRSFLKEAGTLLRQLPVQKKFSQHHKDATSHGLLYLYNQETQVTCFQDPALLAPDLCPTQEHDQYAVTTDII